ncbi:MAG: aspartyl/glutamyl-tRNA amidotransferase subunit B [Proteobacteria bacterium SG_bin7]|nr:MAG: aspartyl/glutamyl-tRNA amidotransferase subunit B [Proteobacteria bacterium SG_bin7]
MSYNNYEPVIGLEIHAQLKTKSKMFCSCSTEFGASDNENTCPICTGMPGCLPVVNKKAIEFGVKIGLALNCQVNNKSVFARKNYFYPDLPKGYQISQYDEPICGKGYVDIFVDKVKRRIGITRAHLEEDAGKSQHQGDYSLINYNRSSVPLMEIVSEPDIKSPAEAAEYARTVRQILRYLDVCDGNLEEGSLRCDCNVSVRKVGEKKFGTKVEIKNINSFRFVEKAIEYEIQRQIDCLEAGEKIDQETRLYDVDKNKTFTMRSKEEANDYRYFPDPDLLVIRVAEVDVSAFKKELPEMPSQKVERYKNEYGLPEYDAFVLTQEKEVSEYYEATAKASGNPKGASNWVMVELMRELNEQKLDIAKSPVKESQLADLIKLIDSNTISGKIAKTVFAEMCKTSRDPQTIIKEKGLVQITDTKSIEALIDKVIAANASQVAEYRSGRDKLFGFFVGQVMKESKGQANPDMVNRLLVTKLKG